MGGTETAFRKVTPSQASRPLQTECLRQLVEVHTMAPTRGKRLAERVARGRELSARAEDLNPAVAGPAREPGIDGVYRLALQVVGVEGLRQLLPPGVGPHVVRGESLPLACRGQPLLEPRSRLDRCEVFPPRGPM